MNLVSLTDAAHIIMGQSPPSSTYNNSGNGLPFFQGKTDFGDMYPKVRMYCSAPKKIAESGDILLSVRAPVGPTNIAPQKSAIGRGLAAIRAKANTDPGYLLYFLRFHEPSLASIGQGSTFEAVSKADLHRIQLPLPPLAEQQRIADILSRADRLRRLRRFALEMSAGYLQAVFLEMFGDPVTNPMGWAIIPLNHLLKAKAQNGLYLPKEKYLPAGSDEGVEMVHMADLFYEMVERGNLKRVCVETNDVQKYSVDHNDLLIARRSLNYEGSAKPCRIPISETPLIFESSMIRITPDPRKIMPTYLYYYLANERARLAHVLKYVTQSTISGINQENLNRLEILTPPISLQENYLRIVHNVERLRAQQREALRQAEQLFQGLLQAAFRGELTPPQA